MVPLATSCTHDRQTGRRRPHDRARGPAGRARRRRDSRRTRPRGSSAWARASPTRPPIDIESRPPIAAAAERRSSVRRLPVRAHRLSASARAQGAGDRRRVRAHRPDRRCRRPFTSRRRPRRAIGCGRGCTCAAARSGSFAKGRTRSATSRQTRQLLPATSDALDRLVGGGALAGPDDRHPGDRARGKRRRLAAGRAPRRRGGGHGVDAARSLERLAGDGRADRSRRRRAPFTATCTSPTRLRSTVTRRSRFAVTCWRSSRATGICSASSSPTSSRRCPPAATVVDLYAGVGLFAVAAAATRGARVTAVEGDRVAAADLAANAAVDERRGGRRPPVGGGVRRQTCARAGSTGRDHHGPLDRRSAAHRPVARGARRHLPPAARRESSTCRATSPRSRAMRAASSTAATRSTRVDAFDLFPEHAACRDGGGVSESG